MIIYLLLSKDRLIDTPNQLGALIRQHAVKTEKISKTTEITESESGGNTPSCSEMASRSKGKNLDLC